MPNNVKPKNAPGIQLHLNHTSAKAKPEAARLPSRAIPGGNRGESRGNSRAKAAKAKPLPIHTTTNHEAAKANPIPEGKAYA